MSINNSNYLRSPCEVIREINDLFQGDNQLDEEVRKKCAEAEYMCKMMSLEISRYDEDYHKKIWNKLNRNHEQDLNRRTSKGYRFVKILNGDF